MGRPNAIVRFEQLYLVALMIGLVQSAIRWKQSSPSGPDGVSIPLQAGIFLVMVGLVLLVSRKRVKIAQWILVIILLAGVPTFLTLLFTGKLLGSPLLATVQIGLEIVAIGMIYTRPAQIWLRGD